MTRRRGLFWLMLVVFVGLAAWWSVTFPYDPTVLYRCMPPSAMLVTEHEGLADHWRSLVSSPPARIVLAAGAAEEAADVPVPDLAADPILGGILDRFATCLTVFGYASSAGPSGEPAWVGASWIGGPRALLLRMALSARLVPGFRPPPNATRVRFWVYDVEGDPRDVAVTLVDGVLIAIYSAAPEDIAAAVLRLHRKARLTPVLQARPGAAELACADLAPDARNRGWVSWYGLSNGRYRRRDVAFALDGFDASHFSGCAAFDPIVPASLQTGESALAGWPIEAVTPELAALFGDAPSVLVCAAFSHLASWLREGGEDAVRALDECLPVLRGVAAPESPVAAALLGGPYSRRVLVRVPTLMFAVRLRPGADALGAVTTLVDRLNAAYGLGLIVRQIQVNGRSVMGIDFVRGGYYSQLEAGQRGGLALHGDWLLLSSNLDALVALLNAERAPSASPPRWAPAAGSGACAAYAWADPSLAHAEIGNVISAYTLALLVKGGDGLTATRRRLERIQLWLKVLRPVHEVRIDVRGPDPLYTAAIAVEGERPTVSAAAD